MAKFKFRLASLLSIKEKMEQLKKNEYAEALAIVNKLLLKKTELLEEIERNLNIWQNQLQNGAKPNEIIQYNHYVELVKVNVKKTEEEIINAQEMAEKKRLLLVEAMKERKMLENLKEKDYNEFRIEETKEEQKFLDEIASYKTAGGEQDGDGS